MDFANQPGQLFVVATLLPAASFLFLLICFAIRSALRSSKEGTAGAAIYQALGGDVPPRWHAYVATLAIGLACVCSVAGFVQYLHDQHEITELTKELNQAAEPELKVYDKIQLLESRWKGSVDWVTVGSPTQDRQGTRLSVGYRIDALNGVMFVMVTFVATLIHLFSIGYMGEETEKSVEDHQVHVEDGHHRRRGRFGRFFLFLSLFCFSMLNLILADNLFQVFVSWELVGICSYLLIGFYFERQSASNAANKAFITN